MAFVGKMGAGSAEYLSMLALAMAIGLGSVAFLNNAQDSISSPGQAQHEIQWKSAVPISIVEWNAVGVASRDDGYTYVYLRVRNNGADPIRITKILAGEDWIDQFACYDENCGNGGMRSIGDYYYLQPGEEAFFDGSGRAGTNDSRVIGIYGGTSAGGAVLGGAAALCGIVPGKQGSLVIPDFGFEYVTGSGEKKQQVGKLAISCMDAC